MLPSSSRSSGAVRSAFVRGSGGAIQARASLALVLLSVAAAAQSTVRVSVDSQGSEGDRRGLASSLSADGRFVAFQTEATNLVPGDTNDAEDIFVHDRWTGVTRRVSVDSAGVQANAWSSYDCVISADGRFVAFSSFATNLVPNDLDTGWDVFVHDGLTGTTTCASVDLAGLPNGGIAPAISGDGRFVAYRGGRVRDLSTGVTLEAAVDSFGVPGNGQTTWPAISADGRFVAFPSDSTNLVVGDTNQASDIFVHDLSTGETTRVSVDSSGAQADLGSGQFSPPALSADGRFVAFESNARNLVPGDTNLATDVFVHDRLTGQTLRASVRSTGAQVVGFNYTPHLSGDGRFVAFASSASDLVPGDTNGGYDVFVHDLKTGETERVDVSSTGAQATTSGTAPAISLDGRCVSFASDASNLVVGDTNGARDIFVRDRVGCSATIASFCDGTPTTHGCVPVLTGSGTPSASASSGFVLSVSAAEGQSIGLVFYGVTGPAAAPFGSGTGLLCVASPLQRTHLRSAGGTLGACDGQFGVDWNAARAAIPFAVGAPFTGGETVWAQAWLHGSGTASLSSLSTAVWFTVCP